MHRRTLLSALGTGVGASLAGCSSGLPDTAADETTAPTPRASPTTTSTTRARSPTTTAAPSTTAPPQERLTQETVWTQSFDRRPQPGVATADRYYIPVGNSLVALGRDGTEQGRVPTDHEVVAGPLRHAGRLYAVTGDYGIADISGVSLVSVEMDGTDQWTVPLETGSSTSLLGAAGSRIYLGTHTDVPKSSGESLIAVGVGGTVDWTVEAPGLYRHQAAVTTEGVYAAAAGVCRAYALDGSIRWRDGRGNGPVVADGEQVYVGLDDGVAAYGMDGTERWTTPLGAHHTSRMQLVDGRLLVDESGVLGDVYSLTLDGELRWRRSGWVARFAQHDGVVYLDTDDGVEAVGVRDGERRWTAPLSTVGPPEPSHLVIGVTDDAVAHYSQGDERTVIVGLDDGDGTLQWRHEFANALLHEPGPSFDLGTDRLYLLGANQTVGAVAV